MSLSDAQLESLRRLHAEMGAIINAAPEPPAPEPEPTPEPPPPEPTPEPTPQPPAPTGMHGIPDFAPVADLIVGDGETAELPADAGTVLVRKGGTLLVNHRAVYHTIHTEPGSLCKIANGVTLTRADEPFHAIDTLHRGNGLLFGGDVEALGDSIEPVANATHDFQPGDRVIKVERIPDGWHVGQLVLVPDTVQLPANAEYTLERHEIRTIESINGTTILLDAPLEHEHPNCRPNDAGFVDHPKIINLDGSITVRSENPDGHRGHVMVYGVDNNFLLRGVVIEDMGDTPNVAEPSPTEIGRYQLHFHGPQGGRHTGNVLVDSCVILNAKKWPITIHGLTGDPSTHRIVNTVTAFGLGSGLAFEDGRERGWSIEGCVFAAINGTGRSDSQDGIAGDGLWGKRLGNRIVNCLSIGCRANGFNFNGYNMSREFAQSGEDLSITPLEISGNKAISCQYAALWLTHSMRHIHETVMQVQLFQGMRAWNCPRGLVSWHEWRNHFHDFVWIGDDRIVNEGSGNSGWKDPWSVGMAIAGYENEEFELRDVYLQGGNLGIELATLLKTGDMQGGIVFDNVRLKNHCNFLDQPSSFGGGTVTGELTFVGNLKMTDGRGGSFPESRPWPLEPVNHVRINEDGSKVVVA